MAINNNPLLAPGENISEELLKQILSGSIAGSKFSPGLTTVYDYIMQGTGDGGDMAPTNGRQMIYQPRNVSTWGGNDTADVWDAQGNYLGTNSGATDARSLARLAAMAAGGYYGGQALGAGPGEGLAGWDAAMVDAGAGATNVGGAGIGAGATGMDFGAAAESGTLGTAGKAGSAASTAAKVADAGLGMSDIAKVGLAGLAAYDAKDQQQTSSKDPWSAAVPYLKGLMADGATLYDQYKRQPFSDQQKTAYNNLGGLLNTINANAGGLMSGFQANASGANNYDRSNPRKQLTGSSFDMSQFQPGLFNFFPRG